MVRLRRYLPHAVVFLTSMGVMVVELIASRIVAKHFGNSLYTWTGIIGIVLGGISLGNFLGGRLADRYEPRRIIPWQLLVTSGLVILIVPLDTLLYAFLLSGDSTVITSAMVGRSLLWIIILFLLPSAAVGTVSPVMAKFALADSTAVGSTVGSIYAVGSIGSIIGTFLAGYLLIPLLGTRLIVFAVAAVMALLGFAMARPTAMRVGAAVWVTCVVVLGLAVPDDVMAGGHDRVGRVVHEYYEQSGGTLRFSDDSQYSHIVVREQARGNTVERQLIMDGLVHNRFDPSNPDDLRYEYERVFDAITRIYRTEIAGRDEIRTLTIGGGALIYPSYLTRHVAGSINDVVEIDPEVIAVARSWFGASSDPRLTVYNTDGRNFVHFARHRAYYDLIYLDAFNSFSVPYQLTTEEFDRELAGILNPDGFVIANCIDIFSLGRFITAYINTLQRVFPAVSVYADTSGTLDARMTFVVVAGRTELPAPSLVDPEGNTVGYRLSTAQRADLRRRNGAAVLTDDHAPVENLMAPVFIRSVK